LFGTLTIEFVSIFLSSLRPRLLMTSSCNNAREHVVSRSAGRYMITTAFNSSFSPSTKRVVTMVVVR
jgi:hypothetical protein